MITVRGLVKQYGAVRAVDDLSFDVEPGKVTGFLGPNGAGKSTTMRILMGLDRATAGTARVNGRDCAGLGAPLHEVGALLDAGAMHPGRTGRAHLSVAARTHGLPSSRVDEVIGQVGLDRAAGRRVKGYSLGMRQRLGIAAALIGDPTTLLFDEPVNGLDLDGVRWIRTLLRGFADQGRTVLVSSHLMSEMQLVADRVIVIGRGRLVADVTVEELLRGSGARRVLVRTPEASALGEALAPRFTVVHSGPQELEVEGLSATDRRPRARPRSSRAPPQRGRALLGARLPRAHRERRGVRPDLRSIRMTSLVDPPLPVLLLRTSATEWLRLRTVRSTWLVAATATLGIVGFSLLIGFDSRGEGQTEAGETAWTPVGILGILCMLVLLALAAVSTTADFGTGGIVPTLQWTPRRGVLLAARTAVIVAFTVTLGLLIAVLAGTIISSIAPVLGLPWDEGRRTLGALASVYALGTAIAVGLGLLLRSTAGAVVSVLGLMMVLPLLLGNLPFDWAQDTARLMPGMSALELVVDGGLPGVTTTSARLNLAAWAAASLLLGGWRLVRTDANR